jgi:hypothetical protein
MEPSQSAFDFRNLKGRGKIVIALRRHSQDPVGPRTSWTFQLVEEARGIDFWDFCKGCAQPFGLSPPKESRDRLIRKYGRFLR